MEQYWPATLHAAAPAEQLVDPTVLLHPLVFAVVTGPVYVAAHALQSEDAS
jgi:hypothetical protein